MGVVRYWVGGTGNYSDTAHWSDVSGDPGGFSVPTSADNAVFDSASDAASYTVTIDVASEAADFSMSGPASGKVTFAGSSPLNIYGNFFLSGTAEIIRTYTGTITFAATSSVNLTFNGIDFNGPFVFDGVGGSFQIQDACVNASSMTLTNGELAPNSVNITMSSFNSSNSNVREIHFGSGTWELTSTGTVWDISTSTNLTILPDVALIKLSNTSGTAKTFAGGGKTYYNIWHAGGAGGANLTISGSNTFNDFKDNGTLAHSIFFTAGITTTVTTWTVSGNAGQLISIDSTTTGTHSLVKTGGGQISSDYLNIQHSVASPTCTWFAGANSTNNQATATAGSGWYFTVPGPCLSKGFLLLGVG